MQADGHPLQHHQGFDADAHHHAAAVQRLLEAASTSGGHRHHPPPPPPPPRHAPPHGFGVPQQGAPGPADVAAATAMFHLAQQQQQHQHLRGPAAASRLSADAATFHAGALLPSGGGGGGGHNAYPDAAGVAAAAAQMLAYHQQALSAGGQPAAGPGRFASVSAGAAYGLHHPQHAHAQQHHLLALPPPPGALASPQHHHHHHHAHAPHHAGGAGTLPFGGLGISGVLEAAGAGAAAAVAATAAVHQHAAAAAAAAAAVAAQQAAAAAGGPLGAGSSSAAAAAAAAAAGNRLRARKADWVIVTEDTAIKNAAGAVAKVLSRMAPQGYCCPVFMERKTARYTGVVSVAVKAIAVARGYVANEGSGHEVGFQPYLRGDPSACAYGACRPPGAPSMSAAEAARSEQLAQRINTQLLSSAAAGDLAALELLQQASQRLGGSSPPLGLSPRGASPALLGGSPPLMGGSPPSWALNELPGRLADPSGGSGGSSVCGEDEPGGGQWADLEQAELAFDVYKVRACGWVGRKGGSLLPPPLWCARALLSRACR